MKATLTVRGLTVELGGRRVIDAVDLAVFPGEVAAMLGPNGAGKTTILRSILGVIAYRGEILVDGLRATRRDRGTLGYVPQRHDFAWDYPISVEDCVLSGRMSATGWWRSAKVADHKAVSEALGRVDLSGLAQRPIGQLSGGQRQRVLVARALAVSPKVLLLDEPFTGLDLPTQDLLTQLFATLAADGEALLMTTHDLVGAMHSSDRVHLLNERIIASGTPAELHDPQLWSRAFGVGLNSPALAGLRGVLC